MHTLFSSNIKKFAVFVSLMAILTLIYSVWLYPLLLQPVTQTYSLDSLNWQDKTELSCAPETCTIKSDQMVTGKINAPPFHNSNVTIMRYEMTIRKSVGAHRIVIISETNGTRNWHLAHHAISQDTMSPKQANGTLTFQTPVDGFQLLIQPKETSTDLTIQNLELTIYNETNIHQLIYTILIVIWIGLIVLSIYWLIRPSWKKQIFISGVFLAIIAGTQIPNPWFKQAEKILFSTTQTTPVQTLSHEKTLVKTLPPQADAANSTSYLLLFKKSMHAVLFAFFTVMIWIRLEAHNPKVWVPILTLLFAISTEVMQGLSYSRTASFMDLGIDLIGILIGALILSLRRKGPILTQ